MLTKFVLDDDLRAAARRQERRARETRIPISFFDVEITEVEVGIRIILDGDGGRTVGQGANLRIGCVLESIEPK
jgi:hypothetical protein